MRWNILGTLKDKKDPVSILLKNRGIKSKKEKEVFLDPPLVKDLIKDVSEDFKREAKKARKIIQKAIKEKFPIVIHGDYDADGICATAIFVKVLRDELSHENTAYLIPNRFEHGYGISIDSIDECIKKIKNFGGKADEAVLISVDTGVTAVEAVDYAKKKGFKVIITDHHQKPKKLPAADCVVWDDEMVGSGVSWVMGRVLGSMDKGSIGLAALATVTDLQPILGLNRSIVREGLKVLNETPPIGIKALHQIAGRTGKEITTYDLGWVFGPRINASGRMGGAGEALNLFLETDEVKVLELAKSLNALNIERQSKTLEMYEIVGELDKKNLPKVIITSNEKYHEGIIGLIAGKLVQTYYRPSIVISIEGKFGKGSARSVKGVDVISFLREFEDIFEDLGGHPMAAGFTIKTSKLGELEKRINATSDKFVPEDLLEPSLEIDLEIPIEMVDIDFISEVERLKPFGVGNRSPLFVSRGVIITSLNVVGRDGAHLAIKFQSNGKSYRGIFFGQGQMSQSLVSGDKVDLVYSAERNVFNNKTYVNLVVKDLKKLEKV